MSIRKLPSEADHIQAFNQALDPEYWRGWYSRSESAYRREVFLTREIHRKDETIRELKERIEELESANKALAGLVDELTSGGTTDDV